MATTREKLDLLIREGTEFSYDTFASSMTANGYADGLSPKWVAWTRRVQQVSSELVTPTSAPAAMLKEAMKLRLVGYGSDRFNLAQSQYVGALNAIRGMLDEDPFGELLPSATKRKAENVSGIRTGSDKPAEVIRVRTVVPRIRSGTRLLEYRLVRRLGAGFSAEVWLAQLEEEVLGVDLEVGTDVALKIYSVANRGYESLRIEREFGIVSNLVHENLAAVYDLVLSPNRPFHTFMVMEFVSGPTLKGYIDRHGPIEPERALAIGQQLFSALAELHSLEAIHRDVKAANILLPKAGNEGLHLKLVV